MALNVVLVPLGLHHAKTEGLLDIGPGYGQVPALGFGELLKLVLPFKEEIRNKVGYKEQMYVLAKSLDGNVSNIRLDAVQFEVDPATDQTVLRLNVDIIAAPASVQIWIESHHSAGR